jgi:iron(III) transport system substrate-binding protein
MAGALVGCDKGAADAPSVVVYCSVDQEIAEPVLADFDRAGAARAVPRFDTEASKTVGLVQRLRAHAARPEADVFWSGEVFHTIRLADEGLLDPLPADAIPADWPADLVGDQRTWAGFALRMRVVAWHTGRVKADEAPASLEDLLDAKWRGRLVMARPEFGTTCGHVASWFVHYGPERAEAILRGLKANEVRLVDGNSTAVRLVGTGQADLCLTDTDDVYAAQRNSWPVAMSMLDHGGAGALAIPNTVARVRGGPNPAGADALVRLLLSAETERALAASTSHNTPVHAAVAAEFPQYACPKRMDVDYAAVARAIPQAIDAVRRILY